MQSPITKLVQIAPPPAHRIAAFAKLDTADGRMQLAEQIEADIDEWCKQAFDDGPRSHLGASAIGGDCDRAIWYQFRWFYHKVFSGKMQRLFQTGHLEEERVIMYLRGIGCTVEQVTEDGEQIRIYAVSGHFGGSTDGSFTMPERYGHLPTFLLEVKTGNQNGYTKMHDVEHSEPKHFKQMSVYGYKREIKYALYAYKNKNTDEFHFEIKELDWAIAQTLIDKANYLIHTKVAPARINNNPSYYLCKYCDFHKLCQTQEIEPARNCRTCYYSRPVDTATDGHGQWACDAWGIMIPSKEAQLQGCDGWTRLAG